MIPYKKEIQQHFFRIVSKIDCSNEKSLAIGVKLPVACHNNLYGVGVIAQAKSPKIALCIRS